MEGIWTMEAKTGSSMSGAATFKMSLAVDCDAGAKPLGSAKWVWLMPSCGRGRVHLGHEGRRRCRRPSVASMSA